ncbi:MAG: 16S rRNA (cytidine(1402)-2'-O)-methyltransferase [Acidiferrobacterales bacterium]|nr:16S rRNA (cytidine(1402)-2'-O)-methyltransferase [Acidiferrobacterales bacterium]
MSRADIKHQQNTKDSQHSDNAVESGVLYIVATPIGNLADISQRAIDTLRQVDGILAEDTRHSKRLLNHFGINSHLRSCHEHNERSQVEWALGKLNEGQNLALISDAGTPLISDPGFVMVRELRQQGAKIACIPGPSSIIAALSVAGLPTDRFVYEGFLPAKTSAREAALKEFIKETRTVVLLESSHRILACIQSIESVLGTDRQVVIARELTKRFETVLSGSASQLASRLAEDSDQTRGEFVVMLAGAPQQEESDVQQTELRSVLSVLVAEVPVKQAAGIATKLLGVRKNEAYTLAQTIKDEQNA